MSDDESEPEPNQGGQSGAHQKVPAAVRKLYDSFTGALNPSRRVAREADATLPRSRLRYARWTSINHLPPEPTTLRKPQASLEWQIGSARAQAKLTGNSRAR